MKFLPIISLCLAWAGCQGACESAPRVDVEAIKADYEAQISRLRTSKEGLHADIAALNKKEWRDLSWNELVQFLADDQTDQKPYIARVFDCSGFAIELRDHARDRYIRAAYVEVEFGALVGHALNAFRTSDQGLVYVDVGQGDRVAYIEVGKVYGLIELANVTDEFIDCSGHPEDFWKAMRKVRYGGRIFDYAYYEQYQQRSHFHDRSYELWKAEREGLKHESDVRTYNKKVAKLNDWATNLTALQSELGKRYKEDSKLVEAIEIYW